MTRIKKKEQTHTTPPRLPMKVNDFELVVRQKTTKDLVAFDFGLMFNRDTNEVQIYVDDTLRAAIDGLLMQHESIILKTNFYSPDVFFIVGPKVSQDAPQGTQEAS